MTTSPNLSRYFDSLRAETESSWLAQAYLPPRLFRQMTELRSILVLGEVGAGKTALELSLKNYAAQNSPRLLTASWRPELSDEASGDTSQLFISQVMDALSFAFLEMISRHPSGFVNAPGWARDFMHWFVHVFLRGASSYHLSRLADRADEDGMAIVTRLLSELPADVLSRDALPSSVLSHLTSAIKAFGLEGIWVFLDGLDTLLRLYPERLRRFIATFFWMLDFFEEETFAFKVVVSRDLEAELFKSRVVITRRISVHHLKWSEEETIRIVEQRMALALGQNHPPLSKLCKGNEWLAWMGKYAGTSPRGWLELTRPVLDAYLTKGKPLAQIEWLDAYRQSPPPLRLDVETGRVFMGWGEISVVGIGYKLLHYLYENRHRPCTKSELYYLAHKGLNREPRSAEDAGWEDVAGWEGALDTALYRLRQAVEWDSRPGISPLYIVSDRGKSQIRLENAQ
ncbi:MAG: hypothetical protein HY869_07770 [Chloroflexi bacterium]|nr:hypothetical protein [Chloroflexota bacterium]